MQYGEAQLRLARSGGIDFILAKFGGLHWINAPFDVRQTHGLTRLLPAPRDGEGIHQIDSRNGTICAIRMLEMDTRISADILFACSQQRKAGRLNPEDYQDMVSKVQEVYGANELLRLALPA